MRKVLVIAEFSGEQLNSSTLKCVACAGTLDAAVIHVLVLGHKCDAVAGAAAAIEGVSQVLVVDAEHNKHALAAILAPQIVAIAAEYDCVLGPSTTFGKDLMPRVAALLGVGQVSDIMQIEGPDTFTRPIYAGNALLTVDVPGDQILVATVRTASWKEAATGDTAAPIKALAPEVDLPEHTRFIELAEADSERPDLQTAKKVIAGGRGLGSAENFEILYKLADKLGAGVGASRAAVDAGFVANDMQVGQTGKIIAPELYIAVGISGAIQHLTGIKDAGTIVAINKDSEAPIFEIADIGLVGDLFEIIPELERHLP